MDKKLLLNGIWQCEMMSLIEGRQRCQDLQTKIAFGWMFQYDVPPKTGHRSPLCLQMFITLYFKKKILSISSKKHKYEAIFSLLVIKPSTSCFCFLQTLIILISISISSACMLIHSLSCLCLLSKEKYLAILMKTILCS